MHYLVYHLESAETSLLHPEQLDPTEREAHAVRGERFLKERSLLRHALERLTGIPAEHIRLRYTEYGKPICEQQPFNMSHSGDMLCIAFHHGSIGVDIERIRPRSHMSRIARRIMCARQWEDWEARGSDIHEFFACWCAAEALVKWCGKSILHARDIPFLYVDGGIRLCSPGGPVVELFSPAPGYAGALAYEP